MIAEPLISVIIPTYKRAVLLTRAIASVRRQTYHNIEIVVVDDESPDNTPSIVRKIPDNRIRYVRHETNRGVSAARNTGIRMAKGEYIALIDDDDEWRNDKLEKQLQVISDYDAVVCMGVWNGYPSREHRGQSITLGDLKAGTFDPSGLLARTYVLRDVMFDENLRQGEDWDMFIRMAQRYAIGWVGEPLLVYNDGGHDRATNVARHLSVQELEKRAAMLYKHRVLFGENWLNYHLADSFLTYVGGKQDRWHYIAHAINRCGISAVAAVLANKVYRRLKRLFWRGAGKHFFLHPSESARSNRR